MDAVESSTTLDEEAFLVSLINSGVKLGLETSMALCERAGRPDKAYPIVHVAGTNGKGSVCAMLAGVMRQAGVRAGFFSSPHLVSVRERIRVDCLAIEADEFSAVIRELREAATDLLARDDGTSPTYFEFLAIAALVAFRRQQAELAILEVGMGGRLDSTNVVTPAISVITHIGLDHVGPLGDTHAAIAREKAGIIKPGVPVVCGVRNPEALAVIEAIAAERQAPLYKLGDAFDVTQWQPTEGGSIVTGRCGERQWTIPISLAGPHQADNAAVVMMVLELLTQQFGPRVRSGEGMDAIVWPARCQCLANGMLLDAAHNPSSIEGLVKTLQASEPNTKWHVLFGAAKDKDLGEILVLLEPILERLHLVTIPNPRAATAEEIARVAESAIPDVPVTCYTSVSGALDQLSEKSVLIAGSLYLAGEVLETLYGAEPVEMV